MKKIIFLIICCFTLNSIQAQIYHFVPQTQTVTGETGSIIVANVLLYRDAAFSGPMNFSASLCSGPAASVFDTYISNGGNVNTPGQFVEAEFRFKKPLSSTNSTETYKFKVDQSQSCSSSSAIVTITVNYTSAVCVMNNPSNLVAYITSPTSARLDWTRNSSSSAYTVEYKKSSEISWTSQTFPVANCNQPCEISISDLTPNTLYNWRVKGYCQNGLGSGFATSSFTTPVCPVTGPTNLNATTWSGSGYYISFTPVTGIFTYGFEYVDLVTNNSGTGTIFYSSTPNEGNNTDYTISSGHSFKFRLIVPCSGVASEWKTINVGSLCELQAPLNPVLVNYCSYGTGGQCGYGTFTWSAVTGANKYEVEYIIYNLSGQQVTGTFQTTGANTTHTQPSMYSPNGLTGWYARFRVRSRCADNNWGVFGDYTTPTPW